MSKITLFEEIIFSITPQHNFKYFIGGLGKSFH